MIWRQLAVAALLGALVAVQLPPTQRQVLWRVLRQQHPALAVQRLRLLILLPQQQRQRLPLLLLLRMLPRLVPAPRRCRREQQ